MSRERPILFSAPMVRALLDGRKTQTRRLVKCRHPWEIEEDDSGKPWPWYPDYVTGGEWDGWVNCPYGQPGDGLWVREGFTPLPMQAPTEGPSRWQIVYAAGGADEKAAPAGYNPMLYNYERWSPSIHMPRWASRLTLEITDVRVQRLQDISEADAIAEGSQEPSLVPITGARLSERAVYAALWESINGSGSWVANPWVWAITFRRLP